MKVWILVFINCIQHTSTVMVKGATDSNPVNCQVLNYKEHFETKKACNLVKKVYNGVDASCVKVTVWKE